MDDDFMDSANIQPVFTYTEPSQLVLTLSGNLDQKLLTALWDPVLKLQLQYKPETLIVDAKDITDCDTLGAILILEIKKRQAVANRKFYIQNSSEKVEKILAFLETQPSLCPLPQKKSNFIIKTGMMFVATLINVHKNIMFLGMIVRQITQLFSHKKSTGIKMRWQDFWRVMQTVGPQALPIIMLIGFLVGLISTFQSSAPLSRFGAQIYIIDLVALGLVREMGPLMTAVLIAGRTASAFAAEIGTMKINQEIDALTTMGIEPIKFLVLPRILATLILTPILSMFLIAAGVFGCFLVMVHLSYGFDIFVSELHAAISLTDFFSGIIKTFVFGAVIASVGCLHGIKTNFGASAVGDSTTKAVVSSLIMLVVIDGIFAAIYYVLGI